VATSPPAVLIRRLIGELAPLMQAHYSFEEIADMFYEVGVIPKREKPYGTYDGNKRDYVREKLGEASVARLFGGAC
jgi:hypothetical protein